MNRFIIHPKNPQLRLINQAATVLEQGGVVAYPTDASYGLAFALEAKAAEDQVRRLRQLKSTHLFTIMCQDLAQIGSYAHMHNAAFRQIKRLTPGPYTFILPATKDIPKRLWHTKRKTIGFRIPDNSIAQALLASFGRPFATTSLQLPGDEQPLYDPDDIYERLKGADILLDGGFGGIEGTTILEWLNGQMEVVRQGLGNL